MKTEICRNCKGSCIRNIEIISAEMGIDAQDLENIAYSHAVFIEWVLVRHPKRQPGSINFPATFRNISPNSPKANQFS